MDTTGNSSATDTLTGADSEQGSMQDTANKIEGLLGGVAEEAEETEEVEDDTEEGDEETSEEETSEEPDEEGEESDEDEEPELYTVKVGGKEFEVSLEELKAGYSRTEDYTRKTMSLADERKAIEAEKAKYQQEAQALQGRLEHFDSLISVMEKAVESEDSSEELKELKEDDPAAYLLKLEERRQRKSAIEKAKKERDKIQQEQLRVQQEEYQKYVANERTKLLDSIPAWKDDKVARKEAQDIATFLKGVGFTAEEIGGIVDHRAIMLARNAMLYHNGADKKKLAKKKVKKSPKSIRPGSPKGKKQMDRERTGKLRAAAQHGNRDAVTELMKAFV